MVCAALRALIRSASSATLGRRFAALLWDSAGEAGLELVAQDRQFGQVSIVGEGAPSRAL